MPSFEGNIFTQLSKLVRKLETLSYHTVKTRESLFYLGLVRYRDVRLGQTDGRTELRQLVRA